MKLDVTNLRYLTADDFRVLTAVEMGMKNHEIVPVTLIASIANVKHGGCAKVLKTLLRFKLIAHDGKQYDGYHLTYAGYDYLALKTMLNRGTIYSVGNKVGVGKESDIFLVADEDGNQMILKLHRLGRVSFRAIKNKRDYLRHRRSASWLYMSRLAALKEFSFMKALHEAGFPTPTPIDCNRHCIVMSLVEGFPMRSISSMKHPARVSYQCMEHIRRLARCGLIHCDFNEFNLIVNDEEEVTIIDFPQMISTTHRNAKAFFDRDVQCIVTYFARKYDFIIADEDVPKFRDIGPREQDLDVKIEASGFTPAERNKLEEMIATQTAAGEGTLDESEDVSHTVDDTEADTGADAGAGAGAGADADGSAATDSGAAGAGSGAGAGSAPAEAGPGTADDGVVAAETATTGAESGVGAADTADVDGSGDGADGGAAGGVVESKGVDGLTPPAGAGSSDEEVEENDDPRRWGGRAGEIMEGSDPTPRIMRRRGGSRFRHREKKSVSERVRGNIRSKQHRQNRGKATRNSVKNREKARLRRDARDH